MVQGLSEGEHHSHRSDQEWRAIVRGWASRLREAFLTSPSAGGIAVVTNTIIEMERETK